MTANALIPHFIRTFTIRSVVIWGALRICMAGVAIVAAALAKRPPPDRPFLVSPSAAILVVGVVAAVGWIYARACNEDLFLANLGYRRAQLLCVLVLPPALLELVATVAFRS